MTYADVNDHASNLEQMERDTALQQVRARAAVRLAPRGTCHFCEADVPPENLFCDLDCSKMHQQHEDARARNGVKK